MDDNNENSGENTLINLFDIGLGTTNKDFVKLAKASRIVGESVGGVLSMIGNMDRIEDKKNAYSKLFMVIATTAGAIADGASSSSKAYNERLMLPSEKNAQLHAHLAELKAIKNNEELDKQIAKLSKELDIPIPTGIKGLPKAPEEIEEEMDKLSKQMKKLKVEHRKAKNTHKPKR